MNLATASFIVHTINNRGLSDPQKGWCLVALAMTVNVLSNHALFNKLSMSLLGLIHIS